MIEEFGIWLDSTQSDAIVTNAFTASKAHVKESVIDYYGGYLVAESVPPEYKSLIKAAPEMYEALHVCPQQGIYESAEHFVVRFNAWRDSFRRTALLKAKGEPA